MVIEGDWDDKDWFGEIRVDGIILKPTESLKVRKHSPDGFAWGYAGSGPAQLALAILLKAGYSPETATYNGVYQQFKRDFIQDLPRAKFRLEVDVKKWMAEVTAHG